MEHKERKEISVPLEDRFRRARVKSVDPGIVHLDIVDNCLFADHARVRRDALPEGKVAEDYRPGDAVEVFLLGPSSRDLKMWQGSIRSADKGANPWLTQRFALGDEVYGTATRYVGDYGVFVRLDSGVDALLHRAVCPGVGYRDISDHIHIGDRIGGEIVELDKGRLRVDISVDALLKRKEQEEQQRRATEFTARFSSVVKELEGGENPASAPTQSRGDALFKGQTVLVIDNNRVFAQAMSNLLEAEGAVVYVTDGAQAVATHLRQGRITRVLLDFELSNPGEAASIHRLLADSDLPVAVISGNWGGGCALAEKHGWGFIRKPVVHASLLRWLDGAEYREAQVDGEHQNKKFWKGSEQEQLVLTQGDAFLKELCAKADCDGAFWVKREREGVYSIRASTNVDLEALERLVPHLRNTAVESAIDAASPISQDVARAGALRIAAPRPSRFLWVMPLPAGERVERAVVFYRQTPFADEVTRAIEAERGRMVDLIERLLLIQYLRESEAFATSGRLAQGLLHEIRNAAGPLEQVARALDAQVTKGNIDVAVVHEQMVTLIRQARQVFRLSRTHLDMIKRERIDSILVNSVVARIVELFRGQLENPDLVLEYHPAPYNLQITLPPIALEQPLVNLLDNAIHHVGNSKGARIVVSVQLDFDDWECPIHILIADNGGGMTAEQRASLFVPRISSKGVDGVGMGLYVSRNLLRSVGGELDPPESVRWLGTRFCMRLPVKIDDQE